jgi:hypothetical protein
MAYNGPEIYITFREYDSNWVSYLNGANIANAEVINRSKIIPLI